LNTISLRVHFDQNDSTAVKRCGFVCLLHFRLKRVNTGLRRVHDFHKRREISWTTKWPLAFAGIYGMDLGLVIFSLIRILA